MNTIERYNYQHNQIDPIDRQAKNITRAIKHFGYSLINGLGQNAIDSYVITLVKTRDGRRALLDINDIDRAKEALKKDIIKKVTEDINEITKQINKNI